MRHRTAERSLGAYLAILAFALGLPLFILIAAGTTYFALAETTRLEAAVAEAAQDALRAIEREVAGKTAMLQALASSPALEQGDYRRFDQQAREVYAPPGGTIVLRDRSGQQLVNTRLPWGTPLPVSGNLDGDRHVAATGQPFFSDLLTGTVSRQVIVQVVVPVTRGGEIVSFLAANIPLTVFTNLLAHEGRDQSFHASLADREGRIIARSVLHGGSVGWPMPGVPAGTHADRGTWTGLDAQGVRVFADWRRIPLTGWVVSMGVDEARLRAPLRRSLLALAGVTLALLLVGWAVVLWVSRTLTRSHRVLVESARALGAGLALEPIHTPLREVNTVGEALVKASAALKGQALALLALNEGLERRVAERTNELVQKTELLETTLDTMDQGLIAVDGQGRVTVCNRWICERFDLDDAYMRGKPMFGEVIGRLDAGGEFRRLPEHLSGSIRGDARTDPVLNYERERPDGTVLEVRTARLADSGFLRTSADVTHHRRHAAELTAARDQAEAASREKSDFVAMLSHEIRTPLNSVLGFSDLLLSDGSLDARQRQRVDDIQSSGAALLAVLDDVLDLSKIEAGTIELHARPFALVPLVESAMAIVTSAALRKGLVLRSHVARDLPDAFVGDGDRLKQILLNLLSNAVKFTLRAASPST